MSENKTQVFAVLVTAQAKDEYLADGPGPRLSQNAQNHWADGRLPQDEAEVAGAVRDRAVDETKHATGLPWRVLDVTGPDLTATILAAVRDFSFGNYGCDDMEDLVSAEDLDVGPALAEHIAAAIAAGTAG